MIEPPPEPIDFTSTERMPVMWPVQRPPSHVSAVALTRPPEVRPTSNVVPPVSQTTRSPPSSSPNSARAYISAATGAIDGPEPTE